MEKNPHLFITYLKGIVIKINLNHKLNKSFVCHSNGNKCAYFWCLRSTFPSELAGVVNLCGMLEQKILPFQSLLCFDKKIVSGV